MTTSQYIAYVTQAAARNGVVMDKALCDILCCPVCLRLATVCDADVRGCGTTPALL